MNTKYYLKIFLGIIGTIFLGAIGSGLWERIISPLIDKVMTLSINGINFFFITYKDSLYKEAANGFHEFYSLQMWILVLMTLPILYIRILQVHPANKVKNKRKQETSFKVFINSKKGYWSIYAVTLVLMVTIIFSTLRYRYINDTITYSLTSLEIINPYISKKESMLLRSQYFSIRDTNEFMLFNEKLQNIAKENKLNLHTFRPL